jgi:hypothetical protein
MSDCYQRLRYDENGNLHKPTLDNLQMFARLFNADSGHVEEFAATMPELTLAYHETQLYPALQWDKLLQQIKYDMQWAKEMIDKHTPRVNNDEDILQAFEEL